LHSSGPRRCTGGSQTRVVRTSRRFVDGSVHDYDYVHHNYDHDDAPPRVVKTITMDSGSTQWPVLTKTNYVEWSSMMKV
jgi:hypothetical protein